MWPPISLQMSQESPNSVKRDFCKETASPMVLLFFGEPEEGCACTNDITSDAFAGSLCYF